MAILLWKQLLSVIHSIIKCMPRMAGQDGNGYQLRTPGRTLFFTDSSSSHFSKITSIKTDCDSFLILWLNSLDIVRPIVVNKQFMFKDEMFSTFFYQAQEMSMKLLCLGHNIKKLKRTTFFASKTLTECGSGDTLSWGTTKCYHVCYTSFPLKRTGTLKPALPILTRLCTAIW